MPENHLYEYAVIRILPRVEREEFINVGIILFSKRCKFLKCAYYLNENKLRLFSTELDIECLRNHLYVFDQICSGQTDAGAIALLDLPERFRWLTATRSASIQTSQAHPGFASDLEETLQRLFQELVL